MNAPNRPINRKGLALLGLAALIALLLMPRIGGAGCMMLAVLAIIGLLVFTLLRASRIL